MPGKLTRRAFVRNTAATAALAHTSLAQGPANAFAQQTTIAAGPFQPTYESLKQYKTPEWFRDAKFGIWAHWSAQCVPEQGDWYARRMYIQGDRDHDFNTEHYGHPSKFGFMEIDNLWRPDQWQPEQLMSLYQAAGAKYFFALANHHDNFDNYDSTYHQWNSTKVGPKRDIIGTWGKVARAHGLKFGVSNHSSHAWHWFQVAYGYDPTGPYANVRYDAATLTKADGKGKWWEGLDPQDLYTGRNALAMPDGINTIEAQNAWHKTHDGKWHEEDPPENPRFAELWYLRCKELFDKYDPDLVYFDDEELPLGDKGRRVTAHLYNRSVAKHGSVQSVVFAKKPSPEAMGAFTLDIERSRSTEILAEPWQTDTCIGDWHYRRSLFEEHKYKTPETVIPLLIDVISKNGNLLLSIRCAATAPSMRTSMPFCRRLRPGSRSMARPSTARGRTPSSAKARRSRSRRTSARRPGHTQRKTSASHARTTWSTPLCWRGRPMVRSASKPCARAANTRPQQSTAWTCSACPAAPRNCVTRRQPTHSRSRCRPTSRTRMRTCCAARQAESVCVRAAHHHLERHPPS